MATGDLITWDYFKTAVGDTDDQRKPKIEQTISEASVAIRGYTARDFAAAAGEATREFSYDGEGFLEVDDIVPGSITAVSIDGVDLPASHYLVQPQGGPAVTWLELPGRARSPEMGFMRNEDYYAARFGARPSTVSITATFGWPEVPLDVKRATIWTVLAFSENPSAYISESIAGYSRTSVNPSRAAIPERAKDLLENYRRWSL